jgi:hypothetical protein
MDALAVVLGGLGLLVLAAVTFGMAVSARRRGPAGRGYLRRVLPFQVAVLAGCALGLAAIAGAPRAAVIIGATAWVALLAVLAARAGLARGRRRGRGRPAERPAGWGRQSSSS